MVMAGVRVKSRSRCPRCLGADVWRANVLHSLVICKLRHYDCKMKESKTMFWQFSVNSAVIEGEKEFVRIQQTLCICY